MSIQLKISPEPGILVVDAMGKFSLQEAQRTFIEILEAVSEHQTRKVIVDGRKLIGNPEIIERFFFGEFAAQTVADYEDRGVSRATKFAYVLKEPMLDPLRFGETVAVNRGMHVKAFDCPEEALQWLGIAPVTNYYK